MMKMDVDNIKLCDGGQMPSLGLGTWNLTDRKCAEVVEDALELGTAT